MSGDSSSIQDLNKSINTITDKFANITDLKAFQQEIESQQQKLFKVKENKATTKNKWLDFKEQLTTIQRLNPNYQGTLFKIAEQLERDKSTYNWFKDDYSSINDILIIAQKIIKFNLYEKHYKKINPSSFNYLIPDKNNLLSLTEFVDYKKTLDLLRPYKTISLRDKSSKAPHRLQEYHHINQ